MKKEEAIKLAKKRSNLILEYIEQITTDPMEVLGKIEIDSYKTDSKEVMLGLNIYVSKREFERHFSLDITKDHVDILIEQLLNDILNKYLENNNFDISRHYEIKKARNNFSGISIEYPGYSKLKINFMTSGDRFNEIIENYNDKIDEFKSKRSR